MDNDKIERGLRARMDEKDFSGVVRIREGDGEPLELSRGLRDRAEGLPVDAGTRFGLASGTKTFTAAAVLLLVERGLLALDESPARYLEGGPRIHPALTVRSLLNHTSGVFDYYDEELVEDFDGFKVALPWYELEKAVDYLPLMRDRPWKFEPGERFSYSNGGYILLAVLVERLAGRDFQDFVRDEVLQPLGMDDSGFFRADELPRNTARGYLDGCDRTNLFVLPVRGCGDGGMYSTAADVETFWRGLEKGKLFGRTLVDEMLAVQARAGGEAPELAYGLGVWIWDAPGARVDFMSGQDAGVSFVSKFDGRRGRIATVLSNSGGGAFAIGDYLDGLEG